MVFVFDYQENDVIIHRISQRMTCVLNLSHFYFNSLLHTKFK